MLLPKAEKLDFVMACRHCEELLQEDIEFWFTSRPKKFQFHLSGMTSNALEYYLCFSGTRNVNEQENPLSLNVSAQKQL